TGSEPGELADAVIGLLAHEDRARALVRWKHSVATGEPYADEARIRIADGSYRWTAARAEAVRDPDTGAIVEWFGTLTDIDEQRRSDRERDMLTALVENSTDFIGVATLSGSTLYVNEAGRRLVDAGPLEDVRGRRIFDYFLPEDLPYVEQIVMPALARDGHWTGDFRLRNLRTGEPVEVRFNFFHIRDPRTGEPVAIATVSPDIRERARSERRLRTLVDAGAALARSLDYAATLENLADLVVRTVAAFCVIDIFQTDANGERTIEQIAAVHAEPGKRALMARMGAFVPTAAHLAHPVAQVFLTGSSSLVAQVDEAWIERVAISPAHAALLRALEPSSLLTVPLVAAGEVLGALTCGLGGGRSAPYDAEDLFFVEELGRRAGTAIQNARLYTRERRIAVSLQAASLPRALPRFDFVRLDAEYRPGKAEATIGGDWYDAFALADGRVAFTVGDVLGNGLHAAITMTKLRQAMQSAAMVDPDPNVMLDVADKTLRGHDPDGYATAIAALYDPRTRVTTLASAGHPGPVLVRADGGTEDYSSPGLLLGLRAGDERETEAVPTPPGSMLVFFTDGLVEATHDFDEGSRRLHDALADPALMRSANPARAIVEAVLRGEEAGDDIALLTARFMPLAVALPE
ncbi:MAG: hypothetical protein QOI11_2882, partial [Candidatus Eremiobacteraeota bacterium]|nr:hypothetical protein [Candidatus Eremiobacteraeota bacterium]